jgi:effector-binding domain-containing protein
MLDTPQVTQSAAQHTAVIAIRIPRAQIREVMGPAMQEVMATVAEQGIAPAGPLFSHHFRMDPDVFDFEVGVPVAAPVTAAGRVQPGELPARPVARTTYRGSYEGLGEAWGEFKNWVEAEGLSTAPGLWESYVSGPGENPDPATWSTELNQPLAG